MPNNDIFSGIPGLDDQQGLENLINNQTLDSMGVNSQIPAALSQVQQPAQVQNQVDPNAQQPQAQQPQGYTSEQIAQLVARNQQIEQQMSIQKQNPNQVNQQYQQTQLNTGYNQRQKTIINELLNRGYTIEQIYNAMTKRNAQNNVNSQMAQRIQNIENHMQQQEYAAAESAFIQKMTSFGDKFGLSEQDLVTFSNYAYEQGINVADVKDVETVFRALYPEQYALRVQRMNTNPTSQIYNGANNIEAPRANVAKLEDAYVDSFLKGAMPNQYSMFNKK